MTVPISFYVDSEHNCSLCALSHQSTGDHFDLLGTTQLPRAPDIRTPPSLPTSIAHYNNWLLIAGPDGILHYEVNSPDVVRGQGIDAFDQMALLKQKQPVDEFGPPVVTFYSSDIQIPSWSFPSHSVIDGRQLKLADLANLISQVSGYYRASITPFRATFVHRYDHSTSTPRPNIPLGGPVSPCVREIAFSFRPAPTTFHSVCGCEWFEWDIGRQAKVADGLGDGFQLMSLDASSVLRDTVALGSHSGSILLRDRRSARLTTIKTGLTEPVTNVRFSTMVQPLLAATADDFAVRLWDVRAGFRRAFLTLRGHTHHVSSIRFSHHRADTLFTGGLDGTVRIWNVNGQHPPHHALAVVNPAGSPVVDCVAGCNRIDSFYYSCLNGGAGIFRLTEPFFEPVVPHRLADAAEREFESLLYFRKNHELLTRMQPRIESFLALNRDVTPLFPLLELPVQRPFELAALKLERAPIEDVVAAASYFLTKGVAVQFIQQPEPQQVADLSRNQVFVHVVGGIQRRDAKSLLDRKKEIMLSLPAFNRESVLCIVQVMASASFDQAVELGHEYLSRLQANEKVDKTDKIDKFLDVGYFLVYPTIYDDPAMPFRPLAQIDHNVRGRLKVLLKDREHMLEEFRAYQAVLASATVDADASSAEIFRTLRERGSLLSMCLTRTYLAIGLGISEFSSVIVRASQVAKETQGFPFEGILREWLESEAMPRFLELATIMLADHVEPARYINALTEVLVVALHAQALPPVFEEKLGKFVELIGGILGRLLGKGESLKVTNQPPGKLALAIRGSIEAHGKVLSQKGIRASLINPIMTVINNTISTAPLTTG